MTDSSIKHESDNNFMTLTGMGHVTVDPDIAVIRLGVQTTSDNLSTAQQENARLSQTLLQSLQQLGISNIKTFQYNIYKIYEFENNQRIDKGYSVRNILEIRMGNMNQVGMVIDTAVNNGANIVDFIDFEASDTNYYYLQALNFAVMNAIQKARSIGDNLGIATIPVPNHITENSTTPIPYRNLAMREGAFTTPIGPGNIQIEASVTIDFIY
ncbi:MAG: SIMPL domain-containing protein [Lachnotalea sp.]